jgi:glycosyltransferase involved in cell wall biosynthesis
MISVIIPVYNEGEALRRCIAGLRRQTIPKDGYEILVVDDGSVDGCTDGLEAEGVRVLRQRNQGPAGARNHGAAAAHGDLLLFIDADCVATPTFMERVLRRFERADVVAVIGAYLTRQKGIVPRYVQLEFEQRYRRLQLRERIDFVGSHAVAFRRAAFQEAGGFRAELRMNEDVDLGYRLAESGSYIVFEPEALVYHDHPETVRQYFTTKFWKGYWRVVVYCTHPQKAISDSYTPHLLKVQAALACGLVGTIVLSLFFSHRAWWLVLACVAASSLSMARFAWNAFRYSMIIGVASIPMLWVRSMALGLGAGTGLLAYGVKAMGFVPDQPVETVAATDEEP